MRRASVASVLCFALAMALTPAHGRTLKTGALKWTAPVPCLGLCPYNTTEALSGIVPGVNFHACTAPFPPQSYSDKVLTAPRGARFIIVKATPTVDWDLFLCAKPSRGNNGKQLAQAANPVDQCQVACPERIKYKVTPGKKYVARAYNWSDVPELTGRYWFTT